MGQSPDTEELMKKKGAKDPEKGIVSEYYSPPRVATYAEEFGLIAGVSRDDTAVDDQGERWDFNREDMRQRATDEVKAGKFDLIVGSVMCTDWSILQNVNKARLGPK